MRDAARAGFLGFTQRFEGATAYLYLDVKGLVTIGFGNLVDPVTLLSGLTFRHPDKTPATSAEVLAAWHAVKGRVDLAQDGGGAFAGLPGNAIRADEASILALCQRRLARNDLSLAVWFAGWSGFSADAQLLIHSMAWAMGTNEFVRWPHFVSAAIEGRWWDVATPHGVPASCQMDEARQNDSFKRRNAANLVLAQNATIVAASSASVDGGLDPSVLYWPRDLKAEAACATASS